MVYMLDTERDRILIYDTVGSLQFAFLTANMSSYLVWESAVTRSNQQIFQGLPLGKWSHTSMLGAMEPMA